jgi:hypothetical protein
MGSEVIIFHYPAPTGIDNLLSLLSGADSILPMIMFGKTAARPPENRRSNLAQGFHHINSNPADIGDRGLLTNPKTLINTSPKVFGKMAINIPVNLPFLAIGVDY